MRGLFKYLIKNYAFLLFIFLEVISLYFVFSYNKYQKVQYLNSSNRMTASVYNTFNFVIEYFELAKVNLSLAEENARLKSSALLIDTLTSNSDSVPANFVQSNSNYRYISAHVINNSVNKSLNYITLNKGRKDGVKPDMGIVSPQGIVGVVVAASENFAMGFSVLNRRWGASAKLKKSGYFGPIEWSGGDYKMAKLMEIPFHVELAVGDTIVTSSYSAVFPEGIMVGTIHSFEQPDGESFYQIEIKLATDFKSISYIEVVDNLDKAELSELDNLIENGATNN
ncbi:MAG: rod shape-determining protein MreC [Draconibacterium sp.]|nr:rod shape-determining protein MreC [Draconibacterium sp.]